MIPSDKRYSRCSVSTPETRDGNDTQPEERAFQRTTLEEGTVLAGRYKLHGLIGEGGMGDVYLATHLKIDKKVAVKVLAPEQMRRTRTVNRFLQEAKAASKIRHPNVVDITDYGEAEGCAFFIMEYLEGEDLSQMLKRVGRIEWERAKRITTQLLEALSAAHKAGIIHRDIKPHNCFITPTDREPDFVKVIDFGIAKLREGTGEQLTRTGTIVGTAEYMSPEQGLGQELDGRSDLYSVGIILFRMLTGDVPFNAANPMGVLYHHIHSDVPPPSEACPEAGLGPQLDALVAKALAKDRDARFADAEAFIDALEAVDDPTGANAPKRSSSPLRLAAIAISAVAVLGTVGWIFVDTEDTEPASKETQLQRSAAAEEPDRLEPAEPATNGSEPREPASEVPEPDPPKEPETEPEPVPEDPPVAEDPPREAGTDIPTRRSPRAIKRALSRASRRVSACGKKAGLFSGEKVTVSVTIAPNGRVSEAKVVGAHSKAGSGCIESAVKKTKLGPAQRPQKTQHKFVI